MSSGCMSAVGRPSRASEVCVWLKLEFRKLRAGEVASLKGWAASALSLTAQWSGRAGSAAQGPQRPSLSKGTFRQSALKWNLPSGWANPLEKMRFLERRLAVEPAAGFELGERSPSRDAQGFVDDLARRHGEARMLGAEPEGEG